MMRMESNRSLRRAARPASDFWGVYRTVAKALESRQFEAIEQQWPLDWTPDLFSKYLKQQGFGVQADVAALDWALHELEHTERSSASLINGALLKSLEDEVALPNLERLHVDMADHFRLVATDWDVGGLFQSYPQTPGVRHDAASPKPGRGYFLTYRAMDGAVRIRQIQEFEFKLLGLLQKRCEIGKACEILSQSGVAREPQETARRAWACLREWHGLGILRDLDLKTAI